MAIPTTFFMVIKKPYSKHAGLRAEAGHDTVVRVTSKDDSNDQILLLTTCLPLVAGVSTPCT